MLDRYYDILFEPHTGMTAAKDADWGSSLFAFFAPLFALYFIVIRTVMSSFSLFDCLGVALAMLLIGSFLYLFVLFIIHGLAAFSGNHGSIETLMKTTLHILLPMLLFVPIILVFKFAFWLGMLMMPVCMIIFGAWKCYLFLQAIATTYEVPLAQAFLIAALPLIIVGSGMFLATVILSKFILGIFA